MRRKIVDDFQDLDAAHRASLRDSLLNLSMQHKSSPKIIRTQLCLGLAALALRMLEWEQPVNHLISMYGSSTTDLSYLLEFLTVLPEEVNDSRCPSLTVGYSTTALSQMGKKKMEYVRNMTKRRSSCTDSMRLGTADGWRSCRGVSILCFSYTQGKAITALN